jgi:hypothetical protein
MKMQLNSLMLTALLFAVAVYLYMTKMFLVSPGPSAVAGLFASQLRSALQPSGTSTPQQVLLGK